MKGRGYQSCAGPEKCILVKPLGRGISSLPRTLPAEGHGCQGRRRRKLKIVFNYLKRQGLFFAPGRRMGFNDPVTDSNYSPIICDLAAWSAPVGRCPARWAPAAARPGALDRAVASSPQHPRRAASSDTWPDLAACAGSMSGAGRSPFPVGILVTGLPKVAVALQALPGSMSRHCRDLRDCLAHFK